MEKELSDMLTDHAQNILVFPEAVFKRHWGGKKNPTTLARPLSLSWDASRRKPPRKISRHVAQFAGT